MHGEARWISGFGDTFFKISLCMLETFDCDHLVVIPLFQNEVHRVLVHKLQFERLPGNVTQEQNISVLCSETQKTADTLSGYCLMVAADLQEQ